MLLESPTDLWRNSGSSFSFSPMPPYSAYFINNLIMASSTAFVYVQISVWPHNGVWAAVVKERWLTTRNHGQKLPVDLFLLFMNRLDKHRGEQWSQQRHQMIEMKSHISLLSWRLTSCAVQRCLALCMRPDEVLCVGLCTTLMGKVFSYMLVQELFATPLNKLQTQNDSGVIKHELKIVYSIMINYKTKSNS